MSENQQNYTPVTQNAGGAPQQSYAQPTFTTGAPFSYAPSAPYGYTTGAPATYTTQVPAASGAAALQQSQYVGSYAVPATSVAPVKGESRIE